MAHLREASNSCNASSRIDGVRRALTAKSLLTLVIEPSSKCNLACTFCDLHSGRLGELGHFKGNMEVATFTLLVEQLKAAGIVLREMLFHGNGEPLLNKQLGSFIRYAKRSGVTERCRVTTNGTALTEGVLHDLADSDLDELHISLDAADRQRYLELKGKDLFDAVDANIRTAARYARETGRIKVAIKYALPHADGHYGFTAGDADAVVRDYDALTEGTDRVVFRALPVAVVNDGMFEKKTEYNTPCELPFYSLMVKFDGVVSACCADVVGELTLGRLQDEGIVAIIRGEKLRALREQHLRCSLQNLPICLYCGNRTAVDLRLVAEELLGLI